MAPSGRFRSLSAGIVGMARRAWQPHVSSRRRVGPDTAATPRTLAARLGTLPPPVQRFIDDIVLMLPCLSQNTGIGDGFQFVPTLSELAGACQACVGLAAVERHKRLCSYGAKWTAEAQSALSECHAPDSASRRNHHRQRMVALPWPESAQTCLVEYQLKLQTMARLMDDEYIATICRDDSSGKGQRFSGEMDCRASRADVLVDSSAAINASIWRQGLEGQTRGKTRVKVHDADVIKCVSHRSSRRKDEFSRAVLRSDPALRSPIHDWLRNSSHGASTSDLARMEMPEWGTLVNADERAKTAHFDAGPE